MGDVRTQPRRRHSPSALGERVRQLRIARGLTQTELGLDRFSKEYISQIERGKTRPTATTVTWLADQLGVDPAFLADGVSTEERVRVEAQLERAEALSAAHSYEDAIAAFREVGQAVEESGSSALRVRSWQHGNDCALVEGAADYFYRATLPAG